jgi:hypothetical protein
MWKETTHGEDIDIDDKNADETDADEGNAAK